MEINKIIEVSKERLNEICNYWNEKSFDERPEREKDCFIAKGIIITPKKEEKLKDKTKDALSEQSE